MTFCYRWKECFSARVMSSLQRTHPNSWVVSAVTQLKLTLPSCFLEFNEPLVKEWRFRWCSVFMPVSPKRFTLSCLLLWYFETSLKALKVAKHPTQGSGSLSQQGKHCHYAERVVSGEVQIKQVLGCVSHYYLKNSVVCIGKGQETIWQTWPGAIWVSTRHRWIFI